MQPSPPTAAGDADLEARIRSSLSAFTSMQDGREAQEAAAAIGAPGAPAVPVIQEILKDAEPAQKRWLAEALGRIQDPSAGVLVLSLLQDPKAEVQEAAARALANFPEPRAVQGLTLALGSEDWPLRRDAADSLAALKTRHGLDCSEAVPKLIDCLSDFKVFVRNSAHGALKAITGQDLPNDPEPWKAWLKQKEGGSP